MYRSILKKDFKRKKTMNLILFIFIILAATFIASSTNNLMSVVTALDSYFERAEIPNYWIATSSKIENDKFQEFARENEYNCKTLELLQITPNDILINGEKFEYSNTITISSLKNSTKVFDNNDEEITKVYDGEIFISANMFYNSKYNLKVGDIIAITSYGKTKEFTLKGCKKDAAFGTDTMGITRMLISENDLEFLRSDNSSVIYSNFAYTDDPDLINKINETEIQIIFNMNCSDMKKMYIMDMLIAAVILIMSLCLIIVSMLILKFTINFTMSEELCEIGVMKAIGITNHKIRGLYIIKYFAISVIGAGLGFILSIPFGKMLIRNVSQNIILGGSKKISVNLICSVITALIVILFCYFCTRKIKRFSPIDAIRSGESSERYSRKGFIHLSKIRLTPVPFMAVNDIFSGLKRFAVMIVIFALGLLLIIIPGNTANTLKSDNIMAWFNMAPCDHVIVKEILFNTKNNKTMVEENLKDIRDYLTKNNIKADVFEELMFRMNISHSAKKTISLAFQGIGDVTTGEYMCDKGSMPQNINEVAITELVAEKIDVKIGDDVQIKNGEKTKNYTVCGLFQSMNNMGEGIRFHQDEKLDYASVSGSFGIQVRYTDNPSSTILSERKSMLSKQFTNGEVCTSGEYINIMIGDISSQIDSVKNMIIAVVLCINVLVTVLMVKSFLTKEKREIAILKAIGFRNSSLVAWQTIRIVIVLFIAIILAAALSTPLSHLIVEPIFRIMGAQSIEFEIKPIEVFVIYPLLVLTITTLSSMLTALQIIKIPASETSNIE